MVSALAMVHSRFSTNTFPSWSRAHPYRYISHNGEINTLRGNINWMHARQSMMRSSLFGADLQKILTVVDTDGSDSAMFDNVLELLTLAGRELPHAMMMMVPEPWARDATMSADKKAFYEFHSCLMEPWDGPASIAFTDGVRIGAVLDRNGLRPSPLLRHQGRPGGDGLRGRRARHARRVDRGEGAAPARAHVPGGHRAPQDRPGRGAQGAHRPRAPLRHLAGGAPRPARRAAQAAAGHRAGPRDRAAAPGGVRLHLGGRQDPHHPHGHRGHRAHRLHGHRHAAGGPLREPAAPLRLLQAALRPGDQPAGGRHPRGDHHGGGDGGRAGGQPARAGAGVAPASSPCRRR